MAALAVHWLDFYTRLTGTPVPCRAPQVPGPQCANTQTQAVTPNCTARAVSQRGREYLFVGQKKAKQKMQQSGF